MYLRFCLSALVVTLAGVVCSGCQSVPARPACDVCCAQQIADAKDAPEPSIAKPEGESVVTAAMQGPTAVAAGHLSDQQLAGSYQDGSPLTHSPVPLVIGAAVGGSAPMIGGEHLGTPQQTATDHALELKEKYESLQRASKLLFAEKQRLAEDLRQKEDLLKRATAAMTAARSELTSAAQANIDLKRQVDTLTSEKQHQELATQRMLNSIRAELDDALMREIVLNPR